MIESETSPDKLLSFSPYRQSKRPRGNYAFERISLIYGYLTMAREGLRKIAPQQTPLLWTALLTRTPDQVFPKVGNYWEKMT